MPRCCTCKEDEPPEAFSSSQRKRRSKVCRSCKSIYNRRWYVRNRTAHIENVRRNNQRYRDEGTRLLLELKSRACADCGRTFPPIAMDFDHVRGEKVDIVSRLVARQFSHERFLEEVAKCDVVCAVCHRLRTAARMLAKGKRVYCFTEEGVAITADSLDEQG